MPKTKNCRSRKREFFEGLLSSDDEPMVLKNRKRRLTNAKNPTTPKVNCPGLRLTLTLNINSTMKKSDKSNSRTPKSNHSTPTSSPAGPSSGNQGLDWEWVKTLDQDPTEKDYFPERFDPPEELGVLGQDLDKPDLDFTGDLEAFSIWVLARLRDKRATNAIAAMLSDPNVWPIPVLQSPIMHACILFHKDIVNGADNRSRSSGSSRSTPTLRTPSAATGTLQSPCRGRTTKVRSRWPHDRYILSDNFQLPMRPCAALSYLRSMHVCTARQTRPSLPTASSCLAISMAPALAAIITTAVVDVPIDHVCIVPFVPSIPPPNLGDSF